MANTKRLADLCEAIVDCPHSTPAWKDAGIIVLRNQNIRNGRLDLSDPSYTDEEHFLERTRRAAPDVGDIVITREAPMGEVCMIPSNLRCCLGQRMVLLKPNRAFIEPKYLLFALQSRDVQREIRVNEGTGSTVSNLRIPLLESLPIPTVPLTEQRAIAHILGTLDDKIELNRRMNATLEEMARTLFKSWFVDFDPVRAKAEGRETDLPSHISDLFPARLVATEIGEIPEGWEVIHLGSLADLEKGLSYKGAGLANEGGLPMINLGCFAGQGIFKAENIKRYIGDYKDRHTVHAGDLVIANTDMTRKRVILGSPVLLPQVGGEQRFLFTHHTFAFRFKPGAERWRRYIYFQLLQPEFREIAEGFATGTTVLALPKDGVLKYTVVVPSEPIRLVFEEQTQALLDSVDVRREQSQTLITLRDTLLPNLISGDLRIQDPERFLSEATNA